MPNSKLDPRIQAVADKYGLDGSDFWELPQKKGTWIAKHSALEVAAVKAHIMFDDPKVIEANTDAGIAVLSVAGSIMNENNRREWATGEASPKNNKNAYPWAMAEKRAKDRVILKLIGIHGLVYSDEEGDFREERAPAETMPRLSAYRAKQLLKTDVLLADIDKAATTKRCDELSELFDNELAFLPVNWVGMFKERIEQRRVELGNPHPADDANETMNQQFRDTMGERA